MSVNDEDAWLRREIDWIGVPLKEDTPFLGICLGAQMLARHLGQRVRPHPHGRVEVGYYPIQPTEQGHCICDCRFPTHVYQWHREGFDLPIRSDLARQRPGFRGAGLPLSRKRLWIPVPSGSDFRDVVPMGAPDAASAWASPAPAPVIAISKGGSGTTAPWRAGPAPFCAAGSPASLAHSPAGWNHQIGKTARGSISWTRLGATVDQNFQNHALTHHICGRHLSAYASEMAWREDNRHISNGEQYLMPTNAALGHSCFAALERVLAAPRI